jgi:2-keto-4-pentenoate hydratase
VTPRFEDALAGELWAARADARLVSTPEGTLATVTRADGERIAAELYGALEHGGRRVVGFKLGAVDAPTQRALGITEPFVAPLYEADPAAKLSLADYVAPALELEIGLVAGVGAPTAVACVVIIDSRVPAAARTISTVVADFGLQGSIAFADPAGGPAPERLEALVTHDGREVARADADLSGAGRALALVRSRHALRPGQRVATGSLVRPMPLAVGTWRARLEPLGEIVVEVVP